VRPTNSSVRGISDGGKEYRLAMRMTAIPDTKTQTTRWAFIGQILLNVLAQARGTSEPG
jgi:hypothetical protein